MIKKLSIFVLVIVFCSMIPVPSQAARAASTPDTAGQIASLRVGDPGFPLPVEVRYDPNATPLTIDPPLPGLQPASLSVTVDYLAAGAKNALDDTCLAYPAAAKTAFTAAANILQSYISSPVQIRIEACWANLGAYILGHSSATDYWRDFSNAPYPNLFYPVALANAYAGSDLDPASDCTGAGYAASNCDDISLAYANGYLSSFYFGTDGHPGAGQIDFESVVLHEIIHGLGFSGRLYAYTSGSTWYGDLNQAPYPFIYDKFASNSGGISLTNTSTYPRPSTALGTVMVGGNGGVYSNGLNTRYANGGDGAKLYTPNPWVGGSSYSHLDEIFNGTPNDLMTYSIGNGQSLHAPGPVGLGVLKDVGWAPQPATNLSAARVGNQANLTWTNNGGAPTGFRIERSPNGVDTWTSRGTVGASAVSYSDTGLTTGEYYYRVTAYNNLGSAYPSNVFHLLLATATALNATPVSGAQINLTWTNNAPTATAATVQRSLTGEAGSWATLTAAAAPGSTAGAYNDTVSLAEGTRYYYQVIVTSASNQSLPSAAANAITYLIAPTNLTPTPASPTQINLAWTNNSAAATAYKVERSLTGTAGSWTTLTTTAPLTGYNDAGPLTEGIRYYYQVTATNAAPASSLPVAANAFTPLAAPTGLATSGSPTFTQVSLTWTNNSTHQTGYDIYRSDGAPTAFVLKGHSATTSYNDTSVVAGVLYNYKVRATNPTNASVDSGLLPVITPQVPPTNFTAIWVGAAIVLSWQDNAANETGYSVERSLDGSSGWVDAGTASLVPGAGGSGSFTDNNPFELVAQYYRICAANAVICSAFVKSAVVPAGVTLNDPAPVYPVAMADPTKIKINWVDNSTQETGYLVQYSDSPSGPWTDMVNAAANATSFDWVIPDGVYYVQAQALNANPALNSPFTDPVKVIKSSIRTYLPLLLK